VKIYLYYSTSSFNFYGLNAVADTQRTLSKHNFKDVSDCAGHCYRLMR